MSVPNSPGRVTDPFENGRWTVDNSESRFNSRLAARSPARSILKSGSRTPNPYTSPIPSRPERRQLRLARHVSFSPFDRVRFFGVHEATSESGRDRFRSVEHRPDSAVFDADPVASPQISDHPFLSRLTGSPSDQRKRRPDLFGSPPVHDANSPKRRFTERMQIAESQLFDNNDDDDDDDDDENEEPTSFNKYMAGRRPPTAADLFDELDDKELSISAQPSPSRALHSHSSNTSLEKKSKTPTAQDENAAPPQQEHRRTSTSSRILSLKSPVVSQSPNTQESVEMEITQHSQNKSEQRKQSNHTFQGVFSDNNRTEYDAASEAESDMEMTQDGLRHANVLNERTPTQQQPLQSRLFPNSPRPSIVTSEAASDMDVTYESNARKEMLRRLRTNIARNVYSPVNRNRTSFAIPEADSDMEVTQEFSRDNNTITQTRKILNTSRNTTPVRTSSFTPGVIHESIANLFEKSPISQGISNIIDETPGNLDLYSTLLRPHEKSSIRRHSNAQSAIASELGSDYDDRLLSMHGDGANNILDEELSQLYDSSNEIDLPSPKPYNTSLSEFLVFANISFGSDLPINERRRTSGFDTSEGPVQISEQAVAAAATIPELELYKTYCEELKEFITADEEAIARIDNEASGNNPSLFNDYINGDMKTQNDLNVKLKNIKEYAGFKALHTLLEWKQTKNDSLISDLEIHVQKIDEEERYYDGLNQQIQTSTSDMHKHLDELKQKLTNARKMLDERCQIKYADESKEDEIKDQRASLDNYRADVSALAEKENILMNAISTLNKRREELEAVTGRLEKEQGLNAHPERFLQRAREKLEKSQKYSGLRILVQSDDIIDLVVLDDISIKIIGPNQSPRHPDNVLVNIVEEHKHYYGNFSKLVHGLRAMVQNMQDINQIVETVTIRWNQAREVHRELTKANIRYYMEINPLEDQDGVECILVPSNYEHRTKMTIILDLKLQDIVNFPAINLDNVNVTLNRAPKEVSQEDATQVVRELFRKNGFVDLRKTLQTILESIRSKPTFPITPLIRM
ncbi:Spc7 kinetochore protein-domain-containing protein [Phascolomyces articulosus]|uniref:Spc7 kinetochore protein-domain-containing protein n=1 Tax=Phascolomyces articulosus TaxID=60185 RepID=A0AAD5K5P8_9FUNG|nr:Spc7 kinetochore protein-domain-containing protein [Phascolomyces articulosus]